MIEKQMFVYPICYNVGCYITTAAAAFAAIVFI